MTMPAPSYLFLPNSGKNSGTEFLRASRQLPYTPTQQLRPQTVRMQSDKKDIILKNRVSLNNLDDTDDFNY